MRKTVLVVGGSGGLGAAICHAFARADWNVVFTYRSSKTRAISLETELRAQGVEAHAFRLELDAPQDSSKSLSEALATHKDLAAAVYAAGPDLKQQYVIEIPDDEWRQVIDIDVNGFFSVAKTVLPVFRQQRGGALVAVTTAAVGHPPPRDSLSAIPKAAIQQTILSIAREEGKFGIRANCVGPGLIDSGLGARMITHDLPPDVIEGIRRNIPLRRFGAADEIAQAVLFLASDKASYISGQVLNVDGAWLS